MFEITVPDEAHSTLNIVLEDSVYRLEFVWNTRGEYFSLCFAAADGTEIVKSIKIVPNLDLFDHFNGPLMPGGALVLASEVPIDRNIFSNERAQLVYLTKEEIS